MFLTINLVELPNFGTILSTFEDIKVELIVSSDGCKPRARKF